MLLFDRQIHMTFTSGQLKVRTEIGGGEKVYDAVGMTLEKTAQRPVPPLVAGHGLRRLDRAAHRGPRRHQFAMPNVLFIGRKVRAIEDLLREKSVVPPRNESVSGWTKKLQSK